MLDRGHLDHLALTVADDESFRRVIANLVARGASTGDIDDLGAVHSVWFTDPDGMRGEIVLVLDALLVGMHEPRPLVASR
jgi:catechol 2,3-dioxygenase-like lactoylglutathione lyase family enzyme